jgi:hypothetical protein
LELFSGGGVFESMATRFVPIDRDTPLLLPPNLRDWVPAAHLVHFILDAVDALDLRQVKVNTRGTGSEQYPPPTRIPITTRSAPSAAKTRLCSPRAL